jgi:rSAM/selenodomain-associated transferase 2
MRSVEKVSVIIPALNEEGVIGRCIESLASEEAVYEIIVADAGSRDKTVEIAGEYKNVKTITTERGRGRQMNRGAALAGGDVFLFLHADTHLQIGWAGEMISSLCSGSAVGGAFTFAIDERKRKYRLIESWVRFRCSAFKLPYGDQGIFMKREIFEKLGGYKDIPLMEDVDIVERMKKTGPIIMLQRKAFTHARKWEKEGLISRSFFNQVVMLLYRLGIDPERLAKIYYR